MVVILDKKLKKQIERERALDKLMLSLTEFFKAFHTFTEEYKKGVID